MKHPQNAEDPVAISRLPSRARNYKKKNVFAAQRFCPYQACPKTKNFNRVYIFVPCSLTTFSEAVETLEFPLDARPSSERQRI